MCVHNGRSVVVPVEVLWTSVSLLDAVSELLPTISRWGPTCVQEVKRIVQIILLVQLCIASKNDKCIANQKARVADSGTRPVACRRYWVTCHAPVAHLCDPKIALDRSTSNQAAHDVYETGRAGGGIDGCAISGKGRCRGCEVQPASTPWIRGGFRRPTSVSDTLLIIISTHSRVYSRSG